MLFYGIARAARRSAARRRLERDAVPDLVPDRRGLDRRLARASGRRSCWAGRGSATRFALCLFLAGLFTFLTQQQARVRRAPGSLPLLYFIAALVLALAVAVETYFQNERWPLLAAGAVVGATVLSRRPDG